MVSLNTTMIDGTGMCGGCRFKTVSGDFHFACVDGPDVDGHIVDFDNLLNRSKRFCEQEEKSLHLHRCHCEDFNSKSSEGDNHATPE
jgi:ferredoxin--NADP+ reductase